jgi:uncharacterized membrane protein YbaN (DUF454 family)
MPPVTIDVSPRPTWIRGLWLAAGVLALVVGAVGIFLPVLPTTPFVLVAAWCFSQGSTRCERWLLEHPQFGPLVRQWRATRAVPLRAKQLAGVLMALGAVWGAWVLPASVGWIPAVVCAAVGWWLWRLPTAAPSS